MLNIKFFIIIVFSPLLFLVISVFNLSSAQASSSGDQSLETEAKQEMRSDETMAEIETGGSVKGVVVSVNPAAWTLAVRDVDEDAQVYYLTVKKATTYSGISSLSDINVGDSITVDCYGPQDGLVAETITLQDRAYGEEKPPKLEKVLVD